MQRLDAVIVIHCNDIEKITFEYCHAYPKTCEGIREAEQEFERTIRENATHITDADLNELLETGYYRYSYGCVVIYGNARCTEGEDT